MNRSIPSLALAALIGTAGCHHTTPAAPAAPAPDAPRRTLPNAVGGFEMKEVPSGEHRLAVHAVNYAPLFARIVVPNGHLGAVIRIVLAKSPSCLDYCDLLP